MRMYQGIKILEFKHITKVFRNIQRGRVESIIRKREEEKEK